jgi:hypothetical protein
LFRLIIKQGRWPLNQGCKLCQVNNMLKT